MKLEIELKEFWVEEQEELEPALKSFVIHEAVMKINNQIKDRVEKHIDMEVKRQVEENMYRLINNLIKTIIETEKVKSRYGKDEVTLSDYIKEVFTRNNHDNKIDEAVKNIAKTQAAELKNRYDLLFASQIVTKINEQGLLKDDVAKLLLPQG